MTGTRDSPHISYRSWGAGLTAAPGDWRDHAACVDDPQLFHSPDQEPWPSRDRREAAALAICHTCPVWRACRQDATARRDQYAVAGRETPNQRMWRLGIKPPPAERAERAAPGDEPWHGLTSGYTGHGCRCARCTAAIREAKRWSRAARR